MTLMVPIALFGWLPVSLVLFLLLPVRRAVLTSMLAGWMFLPIAGFKLAEGIPSVDKLSVTCVTAFLGAVLFGTPGLLQFRFRIIDLPMSIWCLSPFLSSLVNGLGPYDGLSEVFSRTVMWAVPYLIGRIYFMDRAGLWELAVAIFVGGLIYVPFCLYELRMSPQLHRIVYGFHQHSFFEHVRDGGYRPMVFMQHGLMVGMWMVGATVVGLWLCVKRDLRQLFGIPAWLLLGSLLTTTVFLKNAGASILLVAGAASLLTIHFAHAKWPIWLLIAAGPLWIAARATGVWDGRVLVDISRTLFNDERAESLESRQYNEDILLAKAWQHPILGWGGWGRSRVYNEAGEDISITDGLWILALGTQGFVGLASLVAMMIGPAVLVLRNAGISNSQDRVNGPVIALATLSALYLIDCVPNAMFNPVFVVVIGGLAGFSALTARVAMGSDVTTLARRSTVPTPSIEIAPNA